MQFCLQASCTQSLLLGKNTLPGSILLVPLGHFQTNKFQVGLNHIMANSGVAQFPLIGRYCATNLLPHKNRPFVMKGNHNESVG